MSPAIEYKAGDADMRPWERCKVLCADDGFITKKIDVNPSARRSLQSHEHRNEHWTIPSGNADVALGDGTISLTENDVVFIPVRTRYHGENTGDSTMPFIEIQPGAVMDESIIIHYNDDYGRS